MTLVPWLEEGPGRWALHSGGRLGFLEAGGRFGLDRFRVGQLRVVQAALSGHSLLVVSPTRRALERWTERFFVRGAHERDQLRSVRPEVLVIDEAHCVDQMLGE